MVDESKLLVQLQKRQKNSINHAIEVYTPYLSTVLYNMVGNGLPKEDITVHLISFLMAICLRRL